MPSFRSILCLLLVVLATPSSVAAEATIYFRGYAVSVPPPLVLLVCGLALLTLGGWIRKWRGRALPPSSWGRRVRPAVDPPTLAEGRRPRRSIL